MSDACGEKNGREHRKTRNKSYNLGKLAEKELQITDIPHQCSFNT
jgi:hypothetical protein